MRLLLGFLLLLTLFAGALAWQKRFDASERVSAAAPAVVASDAAGSAEVAPSASASEPPPAARPYPSDWGRVIVGRPSGAEPVQAPRIERVPAPERAASTPGQPAPSVHAPPPQLASGNGATPPARAFELTVQAGQSLSSICQAHYHSARPALVNALARYNKLADPSRLRAGQKLRLPPENELLAQ